MDKLEEKVKQIVVVQLGVDEKDVVPSADFTDDLNADSLDVVELAMAFEEEFGLKEISEDQIEKLKTVGDAVAYIRKHGKDSE